MTLNIHSVLVGIVAGFASALLLLGTQQPSILSVILFASAALPVFISGLGWSNQSSITASLTAFTIIIFATSAQIALVGAVTTLLPAAWLAYLSTLARPASELAAPQDEIVWYPLSQLMLHGITWMVLVTILIGWMIGYSPELVNRFVDELVLVLDQSGDAGFILSNPEMVKALFVTLIPMMQSAMWVITLFVAWYFATHIVRISYRSKRPRDDIHLTLRMPPLALFFLGFGLVLMLFNGTISYIGAAITGGFATGFLMAGLAVFHHKTVGQIWRPLIRRGSRLSFRPYKTVGQIWRPLILTGTYLAILLFSFPAIIFVIIGLLQVNKPIPLLASKFNNDKQE